MENAGLKGTTNHIKNIFELRNAFVHNNLDISKNTNENARATAADYLARHLYKQPPLEMDGPYYDLQGTKVILNRHLYLAIRKCFV